MICFATGSPTRLGEPPQRPGGRDDAERGLRVAEADRGGGDAEVGRVGEFGAAAEGPAVDGGDHGHGEPGEPGEQAGVDALQGVRGAAFAQLGDVGAGREDALAAGEDEDARLPLELRAHQVQLGDHCLVDRVAHLRPVQPNVHAVGAPFDEQGAEAGGHQTRSTSSDVP